MRKRDTAARRANQWKATLARSQLTLVAVEAELLRRGLRLTELEKEFDESQHPRDEQGRFTEAGDGAVGSDSQTETPAAIYTSEPVSDVAAVHAPLEAIGMQVLGVEEIHPTIRERLGHLRTPKELTTDHILAAQGMADAVLDARHDGALDNVRQATLSTPVVFADYEPSGAMLTTAVEKSGHSLIVVNTTQQPSKDLLTMPARATISSDVAKEVARTQGLEAGVRELYRNAMFHEMGHVADGLSQGLLSTQVTMAVLISSGAIGKPDEKSADKVARQWVKKHISLYAQHSAPESAGEVMTMMQRRMPLPGLLREIEREISRG